MIRKILLILVFTVLFLISISVYAKPPETPFSLTITTERSVYEIGDEIIKIDLEFKNITEKSATLMFDKKYAYAFLNFRIYRNGIKLNTTRVDDIKDRRTQIYNIEVESGGSYKTNLIINKLDWIDKELFTEPGKYKIVIEYNVEYPVKNFIVSNPVTFELKGSKYERYELEPTKFEFIPEKGRIYHIAGSDIYQTDVYKMPSDRNTSIACSLANEFVFRTGLRHSYVLPATYASPQKREGEYILDFKTKEGNYILILHVNINKYEVKIVNEIEDSERRKQPLKRGL